MTGEGPDKSQCTMQPTTFADGEPLLRVKTILTQECQTKLGLVPSGATSKVQPLDVTFNAEFKKSVYRLRLD